jgi:hypothetical protein
VSAEIFCGDEKSGARVSVLGEKGELSLLVLSDFAAYPPGLHQFSAVPSEKLMAR